MGRGLCGVVVGVVVGLAAPVAALADPPLGVPHARLAAALSCPTAFTHPAHEPVLLVHGTGLDARESWSWNYAARAFSAHDGVPAEPPLQPYARG